ncbi:EpsG family protein [uncultured Clostridium sp.]|uniref:EpsG family protein n=1 Tax=uncultured Clostridium sp. TaxID=59620 RepID=UPI0025D3B2DD|nr:EpsG family protein [uncultured Clostridium sp.]MDU4323839.1 EpsG family protein [Clostridium celatum]
MGVFYATIVSTYIFNILARISYDKKYRGLAIFWVALVTTILVIVSGLRDGIGDTPFYKHSFDLLVQNPDSFTFEGDFFLSLLSLFLMQISTDPQILIFVVALVTNVLNTIMFNKYRSYLELQFYIYIASGYYLVTMNGIRQCLAAAILFYCTPLIIKGKFKTYALYVILISTIHQSALVFIPAYFVVREEAWSKRMIQFMVVALVCIIGYQLISPLIFKALEDTTYGQYGTSAEGGSSIMRTIVNAVPVVLAFLKRKELKEAWPDKNVFVNMSIINLIFVALGMFNWIFNRFTLYLQLYNFVLIPYIIKNCMKGKERRLIYFCLVVCYFIFMYYEQVIGQGLQYKSKYFDFNKLLYY